MHQTTPISVRYCNSSQYSRNPIHCPNNVSSLLSCVEGEILVVVGEAEGRRVLHPEPDVLGNQLLAHIVEAPLLLQDILWDVLTNGDPGPFVFKLLFRTKR